MAYIGNTVNNQGFTPAIDYFNGDGTTVTFTLSRPVASVAQMIVAIDNVIQNPSSAFTVSGNSITFTSAPLSGTNNIWVEYTSLITTYNAISQDPSVIGDITATGGFLAVGDFGNTYTDGTIVDYVTGNARITTGPADGLTIYNGGTASRTALTTWTAAGNVGIGTTSPTEKLDVLGNTDTTLRVRATSDTALILNETTPNKSWKIKSSDGTLAFQYSSTAYNSGYSSKVAIDSSGNLLVGRTGALAARFVVESDTTSQNPMSVSNSRSTASTDYSIIFWRNGSIVGSVQTSLTATSYVTSSDYRLKENIAPMTGALDVVSQLKPVTYNWKADGSDGQGFIAHELQAVVPECVTGEKDAVETYTDEEGNEQTRIKPQGVDTSFLVATLTAAIQEQQAIIEDLKARIETLEAK